MPHQGGEPDDSALLSISFWSERNEGSDSGTGCAGAWELEGPALMS
jgi:hypothetical protein